MLVLEIIGYIGAMTWCMCDIVAILFRTERARFWRMVLRGPHVFFFCPLVIATNMVQGSWPIVLLWTANMVAAWMTRDSDDDEDLKKRRKKALAKVKQVAGKLVVVPEPTPQGA